ALTDLADALGLPSVPDRIECYDMSNIGGTSAVGSMVVFVDGRPEPREYRRFRIRSGDTPDDFRMMAEVLRRRFSRVAKLRAETGALSLAAVGAEEGDESVESAEDTAPRDPGWAVPDLVIVDGGKGQLSAAVGALDGLDITDIPLAGLAKRFEELYLPGRSDPIVLPRRSQALYLVQRIRDEAHRFAITYHREVRGRRALHSELDDIEGIGPGRKKALLKRFGSVRRIREASLDEVAGVRGISRDLAERVKAHLAREGMLV
ncbi:MAG: excinuclease ABC subunit C, partial [Chloroflexi bacterium]|nr:excinuclease ABC subunit C [Chloroflexota bacterium]